MILNLRDRSPFNRKSKNSFPNERPMLFSWILGSVFLLCSVHCKTEVKTDLFSSKDYYNRGHALFLKKKYESATQDFTAAKVKDPSSGWAVLAELALADTAYLQEQFSVAQERYRVFMDEHPNHKQTLNGYAAFMIAKADYLDIPKSIVIMPAVYKRDLTAVENAETRLEYFIHTYPNSSYLEQAKEMLVSVQTLIIQHELYVSNFYLKRNKQEPAISRLKKARDRYISHPMAKEILWNLATAYSQHHDTTELKETLQLLSQVDKANEYGKRVEALLKNRSPA